MPEQVIPYTLRTSSRARWVSGRIRPETGLVITLPTHAKPQEADDFLAKHRQWALRHLDRCSARWAQIPKPWPYGTSLLVRGEAHEVEVRKGRPGGVDQSPDRRLVVRTPSAGVPGAQRVLQRWLEEEAFMVLTRRVGELGAVMGLQAKRLTVRNLRSSWGRCRQGGRLSFNYRLIMAPPHILDYVVVHELAHIKEPNHSPRFWAVVEGQFPEYRPARSWLRTFGPCLSA